MIPLSTDPIIIPWYRITSCFKLKIMGFVERGSTKHMMSDSENDKLSTEIGRPNQVEKEPANVG